MRTYFFRTPLRALAVCLLLMASFPTPSPAQLRGSHLLGFFGLDAGTQAHPSFSVMVIPMYLYHTGKLKGGGGNTLSDDFSLTSYANGFGPVWVTNVKILGANLGGSAFIPFITNRIEAGNTDSKSDFALTDCELQPIQLGWHRERADFVLSYQLYIPAGKYTPGGSENAGLGQWANEITAGTTLKFGKTKTLRFSSAVSYAVNSWKKDSDMKTGNNLSIEGGLGKTWYKKTAGPIPKVFSGGLIYYLQFKTTEDRIPPVHLPDIGPISADLQNDRIFGLGAEFNCFFPKIKSAFILRCVGEMGAVSRFQGATYMLAWAYNITSFHEKK